MRGGMPTQTDIVVGTIFCLAVLEAARRTMGWFLIVLSAIFVGYLFVGPYLPGILGHGGFGYPRVIRQMYMSTEVVFSIAVGVSATYVYLFILFGSFLQRSGTTTFFTNLAFAAAGQSAGGPAKVGVLASGLMGMIGGVTAVFCMGAVGERYLTRVLRWWKVALLLASIVLVMHPAALANAAAAVIALFVGVTEYLARSRKESVG